MRCPGTREGSACGTSEVYRCSCGAVGCTTSGCSHQNWEGEKCAKCGGKERSIVK